MLPHTEEVIQQATWSTLVLMVEHKCSVHLYKVLVWRMFLFLDAVFKYVLRGT